MVLTENSSAETVIVSKDLLEQEVVVAAVSEEATDPVDNRSDQQKSVFLEGGFFVKIKSMREDFPFFDRNKDVIYFDNACQSLRPKSVVEAIDDYYFSYSTCAERSAHRLGDALTNKIDEARKRIADFINASPEEIIFTKNTTEGINLIANSFPYENKTVLTLDKEHNSNFLPWRLKSENGFKHFILETENGTLPLEKLKSLTQGEKIDLISFGLTSNIDGLSIPAKEIIDIAKQKKIRVLFDAAQTTPHFKIDVKNLGADFLAFSGHKMFGPSGTGVLYVKKDCLNKLKPFMVGGGTVSNVSVQGKPFFYDNYERFEAGLQDYAGIIGLGAAVKYIEKIGLNNLEKVEGELFESLLSGFKSINGIKIINDKELSQRAPLLSFYFDGIDSHEIALMLDKTSKIMVRAGAFCNHYYFNTKNLPPAMRVSLAFYNTKEEIGKFIRSLKEIIKTLK